MPSMLPSALPSISGKWQAARELRAEGEGPTSGYPGAERCIAHGQCPPRSFTNYYGNSFLNFRASKLIVRATNFVTPSKQTTVSYSVEFGGMRAVNAPMAKRVR